MSGSKSYILWICVLLCLTPFVVLSFFNFMAYDDYLLWGVYRDHSFFEAQKMIYLRWEGRFTANFICGLFEVLGIVRHYYFLVFLVFGFCTYISLWVLLRVVNNSLLGRAFPSTVLPLAAMVLFLLDLYVMAEIATGVYWFSSAAVYQSAFILFLLLGACLVQRLVHGGGLYDIGVIVLSVLICGCNEIAAIALASGFLLLIVGCKYLRRPIPRMLLLYLGVVLLTGILVAMTSGVLSFRTTVMKGQTGYAGVALILLMRMVSVFYYILKEPLFWSCIAVCYMLGVRMSGVLPLSFLKGRRIFLPGLTGIVLLVFLTLAPVLVVTHGSLPERAINNLTALTAFYLLALVFLAGAVRPDLFAGMTGNRSVSRLLLVLLCSALLASYNYKEAWKNVMTGYFYHAIQVDRDAVLSSARAAHQRQAEIRPYSAALSDKVRDLFPHGAPVTVQRWLQERPTYLYFDNEAEEPPRAYLLNYYQLDTVIVRQF